MSYDLIDEPSPTSLAEAAVRPFWIFLSLLVAGAWFAFPWFVFNAHVLGSPTKKREMGMATAYFAIAFVAASVVRLAVALGMPWSLGRYGMLWVVGIKIAAAFWIVSLQSRPFERFAESAMVNPYPALILLGGWLMRDVIVPVPTSTLGHIVAAVLG
ncbi:MAG: hypothetical protein AAFV29_25095 [Myxococcota bacterium]